MNKTVVPYNPLWMNAFAQEAAALRALLSDNLPAVHHIGTTSIPGMRAKPIIDIMLEVRLLTALDQRAEAMRGLGYEVMGAYGINGRRYFRKVDQTGTRSLYVDNRHGCGVLRYR
ncbi:MAG: GrpB family protein [Stappiaceae bacterium]